jgi:hypothetical protein
MSDIDDFEDGYADASDSVGTLRIGKTHYAVSLIWQEADDDTDPAAAARSVAADTSVNGDFLVLRPQSRQFGIGHKDKSHAKGMPSLGAHIAESRRGTQASWLGLFEVEGGFYVIAVRDELILAQTDRFYADEMHARGELDNLLNLDDWGETFAPVGFEIENSTDKSLVQLLAGKPPRLRDIDKMGGMAKWGVGLILLLLIIGGGLYYQNHLAEVAAEVAENERIEQLRAALPGGQATVPVPPMPWEDRPTATAYLDACMAAMHKAVLDFPGWKPDKIECDANANVKLDILRATSLEGGGGTVNWIRWTLDKSPSLAGASILPQGPDGATITWTGGKMENYPPDLNPRAPDIGKSRFYLQSWFEEAFTTITFPKAAQNDFFRTVSFTFTTQYEPTKFSSILGKVPGLTIEKVTSDLKRFPLTYQVEGSVNEQLPLPKNARRPATNAPTGPTAAAGAPATSPRT